MKKGITLVAVLAVIVVLSILTGSISISAVNIINSIEKNKFAMEFAMVEEAFESYYSQESISPYGSDIQLDLTRLTTSQRNEYFPSENIVSNKLTLRIISLDKLEIRNLSLGYGKDGPTDVFAYSETTKRIYYVKGKNIGNKIYYYLNDELRRIIKADKNKITNAQDGILIEYDKSQTSKPVTVLVKVPKNLTEIYVTTDGPTVIQPTDNSNEYKNDSSYHVFIINKDESYNSSYNINIKYRKKSNTFSFNHYISRTPSTNSITIDSSAHSQIFRYDVENKIADIYLTGLKFNNIKGEIAVLKYENFDLLSDSGFSSKVKDYFEVNGIKVRNDRIIINRGVKVITVYVEDTYGNYGVFPITIDKAIIDSFEAVDGKPYANPPIPYGFSVFNELSSYTSWNGNFIIQDSIGNQFVWVPIADNMPNDGIILSHTNSKFGRRKSEYNNGTKGLTNFTNFEEKDSTVIETSNGELNMLDIYESVNQYGGFYISRYQISKDSKGLNKSVSGVLPISNASSEDAVKMAKEMGGTYKTSSAISSAVYAYTCLPTASHYDTLFKYLETDKLLTYNQIQLNSSGLGNYTSTITNTGSQAGDKLTIKDLAGNIGEWTYEKYNTTRNVYRSGRGTNAQTLSIGSRNVVNTSNGFRTVLYLTDISK